MDVRHGLSRRGFVGGVASALGALTLVPGNGLLAQASRAAAARREHTGPEYDGFAKLGSKENPYGPSDAVMRAMTEAWKYANRYAYPDGGIREAIAKHHGVAPENVLLGAGSGEILEVVGLTFLDGRKKVVGVEPSYAYVYEHASGIKSDSITIPLLPDYRQNIPAMIRGVKANYRDIGFVYLCTPNNPTARVVTSAEVKQLLDGIPDDVPVLIDEAYHHYVDDPAYATSIPYVIEGRQVIVARTFSKICGLAGMRLGYAVAPAELVRRMRNYSIGSINAIVKYGGVAALKDTETQARVKKVTIELREKTIADLRGMGYSVIPSDANFFMVHIRRQVQPVIDDFRKKGVLVGRPFPPMLEHLRVSVGSAEEMGRFTNAFKEIFAGKTARAG